MVAGRVKPMWRRWSELGGVERVALYTRQSLFSMLVGVNGYVLVSAARDVDHGAQAAGLIAGGVAVSALGVVTLGATLDRYPTALPPPWRRIAPLLVVGAAYLAVGAATWPDGARGAALTVVVVTSTLALGVLPDNRIALALVAGAGVLFGTGFGEVSSVALGMLVAVGFLVSGRVSLWVLGIVRDLDEARRVQARMAVMEERLRFSRDVHDVLGRRLSTIAVQAELAATLAERGDERVAERMREVRGVAHAALREARELARGYGSTSFSQELEGARSLLTSAGIEVRLSVDAVPRAWHEAAGWVVRESVTNVLRHSSARCVEITYADGELRVDNDGAHLGDSGDGSGLRGLRERLLPLGASLDARPDGDDRWSVVAWLPGAGPLSAATMTGLGA